MAINREDWVRSVVPSGTVIAFAGVTPPTGWLLCDGATISRAAYPALFTAISIAHGSGDGSTTFHLPDYQGRFLRGVANGSANDPDRALRTAANAGGNGGDAVGSVQSHTNESHGHHMFNAATGTVIDNAGENYIAKNPNGNTNYFSYAMTSLSSSVPAHGLTESIGGSESRPKNANVNYIIRAV
jgi:microcystin-dependent protein